LSIRPWVLVIATVALGDCRSQPSGAASSQTNKAQQLNAQHSALPEGRSAAVALRIPAKGGTPRLYRLPSLAEIPNALHGRIPASDRLIGVDAGEGLLYVRTTKQELLGFDLESGRADTVAVGVVAAAMGPDGTLYAVDGKRHVVSFARRSRVIWAQPLAAAPSAVFGGADQRMVAVLPQTPARLVSVASDQPPVSRSLPTTGGIAAARWGDLVAVAADSGVLLLDPSGRRAGVFIPLPDHPRALAFSPSGHRIYVARKTGLGLAVIDRFGREEMDGVALPGPAVAVRLDPLGRWLIARSEFGDSVWVVDLPTKTLSGSVGAAWSDELPGIAPDGTLLVAQGADVVSYRPDSLVEQGRAAGAAGDLWVVTDWLPSGAARTAALAGSEAAPAAGADSTSTGAFYVQVSISQNQTWSQEMASQLSRAGLAARVLPPASGDDGYRVVLGPYATREQAEDIGRKLGRPFWIYEPGQ
jgi:DNA-binding beta-propeller fold protein YncE